MITQYQKRAFQCGKTLEIYEYARPIFRGLSSRPPRVERDFIPKPRTSQSTMRTRKKIRQLVNSNATMDKFLTLTFAENVTDIKEANYQFNLFIDHIGEIFTYSIKHLYGFVK